MVNLLSGELKEGENNKKKEGEIKKGMEMVEPELPKESEPAKPSKAAVPPTKPPEIAAAARFDKSTVPPAPQKPEAAPHGERGFARGREWTLPKQAEERGEVLPEVSLSPEKIVILPRTVRTSLISLLIGIMVFLFIFTGAWWLTNHYLKKSLREVKAVQEEIKTVEKEIEPYLGVKQEISNIENKFGKAQRVLRSHIYWTKFFTLLEKYTVPEVSFNGFSGNTSGSIHLNAGTLSLPSVARQMLAFKEASDFVEKVEISNIAMSVKGITFSLELILKPDVFYLEK